MKFKLLSFAILLTCMISIQSCVNLKSVNAFSKTAEVSLKSYDSIGYSWTYSFNNFTRTSTIYNNLKPGENGAIKLPDLASDSALNTYLKADAATGFIITSITSYFQGLDKLSSANLVNYNFDTVAHALTSDAQLTKMLGVTSGQINASAKIASVLANDIMGVYTERKLRSIMIKYNGAVDSSITALCFILDNTLTNNIISDEGLLKSKYLQIVGNTSIDLNHKVKAVDDYTTAVLALEKSRQKLSSISAAMKKIKEEHNSTVKLLSGNSKLTSADVISLIQRYSGDIITIYNQINAIK